MRIIISPAKKLNEGSPHIQASNSQPVFLPQAQELIDILREKDSFDIASMMKLSMNLADLNVNRFQQWQTPFTSNNAKQALFSFAGDVYQGLDVSTFSEDDLNFAQQHLRILSGLYGLLRPLDLMQPYRLEMGTKLATNKGNTLYDFWGSTITERLNTELETTDTLINLASQEYFKSVQSKHIHCPIITPIFKENKNGVYKVVGIYAKKARGLMARFIIQQRMHDAQDIKSFDYDGYTWNKSLSHQNNWVFTRN